MSQELNIASPRFQRKTKKHSNNITDESDQEFDENQELDEAERNINFRDFL